MKKIIFALLLIITLICVLPMSIFAESDEAIGDVIDNEAVQHTIFSRAWEYFVDNQKEVLTVIGDSAIVALGLFVKLRNDKKTKDIANDLKEVKGHSSGTFTTQSAVVGVVNEMVDGYQGMKTTYEKYQSVEDDRNKLIGAVMVQNTALLEILNTVYINNKNLPQGVKDLVNLKYANCLKTLENDEVLSAIVESVREKVGSGEPIGEKKNETEAVEV